MNGSIFRFLFSFIILISSTFLFAQPVYPSAGAFWVGGAGNYIPTDSATLAQGLKTYQDVVKWEAMHADFSAWTGLQYRQYAPNMPIMGYMYTGAIDMEGLFIFDLGMRPICITNGHDWEDNFLHYKQDTWLNLTTLYQDSVPWAGVPLVIGYTSSSKDTSGVILHGTGTWSPADIFEGEGQGGAFYLQNPEKFAEATFSFSTGGSNGTLTVQYASAVDNNLNITQWTTVNLTSDSTHNFSQSGKIKWTPPSNWVWGRNPVPKGVLIPFGHWLKITGSGYTRRPLLTNLHTRAWLGLAPDQFLNERMTMTIPHNFFVKNLGWDSINDRNHDGYVEDNEYPLLDPNATARFRYEARLNMVNATYANNYSLSLTNTVNANYIHDATEYYKDYWGTEINGGYNDNFWHDMGPFFFPILAGGGVLPEGSILGSVQDTATQMEYSRGFDGLLKTIRQSTGSSWMGTNLYFINPYDYNPLDVPFPSVGKAIFNSGSYDWFLLEDGLQDAESMVNAVGPFTGLSRMWHIPAFVKAGKKAGVMSAIGPNLLTPPSTAAMWERSQSGILAQYYLYHFPAMTFLQTKYYNNPNISLLTTTANYYKPGVPSNYAYQPHNMMSVDIGTPTGVIPSSPPGYTPMPYTAVIDSAWELTPSVIGNSVSTTLNHPVYGSIPVQPTAAYYLKTYANAPYTSIVYNPQGQAYPAEVVVARQYTKGMVLFRTPFSLPTNTADYISDANEITVSLPGTFHKVNFDGTLGPAITQITLHGFEGAVLSSSGLQSGTTTSIENFEGKRSESNVIAYPNPCSAQNQETQINFSQISANSTLQIFSMSTGRLIKTMIGLSGTASWDLTNDSGEGVASGIYLYAITDQQNNISRGRLCVIK